MAALARRGHKLFYTAPADLLTGGDGPKVRAAPVTVLETEPYFLFQEEVVWSADSFQLVLMRKDPPVDLDYLQATYWLSEVTAKVPVINSPQALRDWNEKRIILNFPQWIPRTIVTSSAEAIDRFQEIGGQAILKPLDGFAGRGVVRLSPETKWTGTMPVMVQEFLPAVEKGEKRIFVIDGKPLGAILKIPPEGQFLTNPDLGGRMAPTILTRREKKLCEILGPFLKKNRIFFAGVDTIDEKLTEINITSPGLVWEWNEVDGQRHEEEIVEIMERRFL